MGSTIISFDFNEKGFCKIAFGIRREVFVEEQKVPKDLEYDGKDEISRHYLIYNDEKAVGTCRWRETEEGIKLERFAILQSYRDKGLGGELLKEIIKDVKHLKKSIYLHSQESAVAFYKKHNFKIRGSEFYEAGIKHFKMILE